MKDYEWTLQEKREYDFICEWQDTHHENPLPAPTYADAIEWADTHPNWIKAEDRLPEALEGYNVSDMVLVAWFGGTAATVAEYNYKTYTWLSRDDKLVVGVTHWMPIVLPKED